MWTLRIVPLLCRAWVVLAAVVLWNAGCYSSVQTVAARDLGPLVTSDHREPLFLRTTKGRGVRLDPNSQISVLRAGRGYTAFQDVGSLETGKQGLRIEHPLTYEDLHKIQVTGLDPISTEALKEVFGPTMKPSMKPSMDRDQQTWSFEVTEPAKVVTQISTFVRLSAQKHVGDEYETYRRRWRYSEESVGPMEKEEFGLAKVHAQGRTAGLGRWTFYTRWEKVAEMELAESARTRPLFDAQLRRKSIVRFVFSGEIDVGTDFTGVEGIQTGGLAAFRFKDLIEIGASGRYVLSMLPGAPSQPASLLHNGVGSFHLGVNLNLDALHRFSIPLAMELGAGGALRFQGRFQIGLRVRVAGPFYLGLYPLNPLIHVYQDDEDPAATPPPLADVPRPRAWTFRTALESGVAF